MTLGPNDEKRVKIVAWLRWCRPRSTRQCPKYLIPWILRSLFGKQSITTYHRPGTSERDRSAVEHRWISPTRSRRHEDRGRHGYILRLKREDRIKTLAQAAERTASVRSLLSSDPPPTEIYDNGTNKKTYLTSDLDQKTTGRRKPKTKISDQDEKKKRRKSKSVNKSDQVTMHKVTEPVEDIFIKSVDYRTYHVIEQWARYDDGVCTIVSVWRKTYPSKWRTWSSLGSTPCR